MKGHMCLSAAPGGHQEVACALGRGARQHRRLHLQEALPVLQEPPVDDPGVTSQELPVRNRKAPFSKPGSAFQIPEKPSSSSRNRLWTIQELRVRSPGSATLWQEGPQWMSRCIRRPHARACRAGSRGCAHAGRGAHLMAPVTRCRSRRLAAMACFAFFHQRTHFCACCARAGGACMQHLMARVTRCRSRRLAAMAGRRRSSTRCRSRCSSRSAPGLACAQGKTLNCENPTWIQVRHPVPQPLLIPQPLACPWLACARSKGLIC